MAVARGMQDATRSCNICYWVGIRSIGKKSVRDEIDNNNGKLVRRTGTRVVS